MSNVQVWEMNGQASALRCIREVVRNGVVTLRFSQVTFLLNIDGEVIQGSMILWNDAANEIQQLHLGSIYRFKAVAEKKENIVALHFIPSLTHFQAILDEINSLATPQRGALNAKTCP